MKPFDLPDAVLPESSQLHNHMRSCALALSPLHRLRCAGEALNDFLAPRFVTTLLAMTLLLSGVALAG